MRLTDYNNKEIHAVESCVLSCVGNADCLRIRFIVMKGGPSLLGHEACEKLYLVRRILNKEECSRIRKVLKVQAEAEVVNDIQNYTLPDVREKLSSLPFTHDIVLRENCTPVINATRRVPVALKSRLKEELLRMQRCGVIEKVEVPTDWVNSIVVVGKPDGKLRVCLDPKDLNKAIKRERFELPTRDDIFAGMADAKVFSKLDASQAFWQIKLGEQSQNLTTFNTPFGRYKYCRLPYGLCSAPEVFHKTMEVIMEDIEGVRVYMDDVVIWGVNLEEHNARLKEVLMRIQKYGLMMNWEKCKIRQEEITFVGEVLSRRGVRPSPTQIEAILNMKKPDCKEAVQRALGSINYVGKFVDRLSSRCKHMRALLCKKVMWAWTHEHDKEWKDIKQVLSTNPVLAFFDAKLPTKVSTDASKDGLGAVLLQKHQEG